MSPFPYPSSGQGGGQGLIQPIGWGAAQGRIQPIGWGGGATQGRIQPVGWGNSKVDPADWLGGNSRTDPVGRFGGPLKGGSSQSVWGVNSRAYPAGRFAGQLKGGSSRSVWGEGTDRAPNLTYPKFEFFLGFGPLYFENPKKYKIIVTVFVKLMYNHCFKGQGAAWSAGGGGAKAPKSGEHTRG